VSQLGSHIDGWRKARDAGTANGLADKPGGRPGRSTEVNPLKTSSMSRDQAIFVDQATDASVPSDAVLLKVDRLG